MVINKPYLLFLGDAPDQLAAKTAEGVAYWRRSDCVGQMRLPGCKADLQPSGLDHCRSVEARCQYPAYWCSQSRRHVI